MAKLEVDDKVLKEKTILSSSSLPNTECLKEVSRIQTLIWELQLFITTWEVAAELSGVIFGSAQLTVGAFPSNLKLAFDIFCLEKSAQALL